MKSSKNPETLPTTSFSEEIREAIENALALVERDGELIVSIVSILRAGFF